MTELKKREYIHIMRPHLYEISGCDCGNNDPDWSEYERHLWCEKCQKDFVPEFGGVFDGPIPVKAAMMLGLSFDVVDLKTKEVLAWDTPEYNKFFEDLRVNEQGIEIGEEK